MELTLDRSEFFTLAALMHANDIIGLAPEQLLPPTPTERQQLYSQGEARLHERDLLRVNSKNEAVLEASLLTMMRALVNPQNAILAIRTVPGTGKQLFLYYEQAGQFVEQTLPNERSHRLAQVGGPAEMTQRLLDIFPVTGTTTSVEAFNLDQAALFQFSSSANTPGQAESILQSARTTNQAMAAELFHALESGPFNGTIAFLKCQPERDNASGEIAIVQGRESAWVITQAADDPQGAHIEPLTADRFQAIVNAALDELRR